MYNEHNSALIANTKHWLLQLTTFISWTQHIIHNTNTFDQLFVIPIKHKVTFLVRRFLEPDTESLHIASMCGDLVFVELYCLSEKNFKVLLAVCLTLLQFTTTTVWSCLLLFRQYWAVNSSVLITKGGVTSSVSLRLRRPRFSSSVVTPWNASTHLHGADSLIFTEIWCTVVVVTPPQQTSPSPRTRWSVAGPARNRRGGRCGTSRGVTAIRPGLGQEQAEIIMHFYG